MSHRNHVRAAQTVVLRDSLAGSSMSILTLVVAAMIATRLLGDVSSTRTIEIPAFDIPTHDVKDVAPTGDAPPAPIPPSEISKVAEILPVDPAVATPPTEIVAPTSREVGADVRPGNEGDGRVQAGPDGGGPGGGVIPPSTAHIWHEEIPRIVTRVMPVYPEIARQAGLEGKVVVAAFVGVDGRVQAVEREGRASVFDQEALDAVRQWVFTPAKADDHPVAVWVRVPVVFQLR